MNHSFNPWASQHCTFSGYAAWYPQLSEPPAQQIQGKVRHVLPPLAAFSAKGPGRHSTVWERCQFLPWVQRTQLRSRAVPETATAHRSQDGMGSVPSVVPLRDPLPGWKHALFLPPSWHYKQQRHWSLFSEGGTRASWCSIWCLRMCQPRNICAQQSQPQQPFPTGISGCPSRLMMLLFPSLPSGKGLVVLALH